MLFHVGNELEFVFEGGIHHSLLEFHLSDNTVEETDLLVLLKKKGPGITVKIAKAPVWNIIEENHFSIGGRIQVVGARGRGFGPLVEFW